MSRNDYLGFTLDARRLGNILGQDPQARNELLMGIQESANAPLPLTTQLGAANLAPEGAEPVWMSLFAATVRGKNPHEPGLIYRNNRRDGSGGERVKMRLRRQPKRQQAQTAGQVVTAQPQTAPPAAPQVSAAQAQALLQSLAASTQPQPAPQPQVVQPPVAGQAAFPTSAVEEIKRRLGIG